MRAKGHTVSAKRTKGKQRASRLIENPLAANQPGPHPFPHLNPSYPIQKVILAGSNMVVKTLCVEHDGEWIATVISDEACASGKTKYEAEEAVRKKILQLEDERQGDFHAKSTAAELARQQGVGPIRRVGQLQALRDPDPKEAEWFVRQVRRWRREGSATGKS